MRAKPEVVMGFLQLWHTKQAECQKLPSALRAASPALYRMIPSQPAHFLSLSMLK
jgi:hypothetical protein